MPNRYDASTKAKAIRLVREPGRLSRSLAQFVGHPAYGMDELRGDLERFVFLLGADDSESLFGPDPAG